MAHFMNNLELIGGKDVIDRIQKAYGFAKRKDLGEHLGISPSTFSTWVSRSFFSCGISHSLRERNGRKIGLCGLWK